MHDVSLNSDSGSPDPKRTKDVQSPKEKEDIENKRKVAEFVKNLEKKSGSKKFTQTKIKLTTLKDSNWQFSNCSSYTLLTLIVFWTMISPQAFRISVGLFQVKLLNSTPKNSTYYNRNGGGGDIYKIRPKSSRFSLNLKPFLMD